MCNLLHAIIAYNLLPAINCTCNHGFRSVPHRAVVPCDSTAFLSRKPMKNQDAKSWAVSRVGGAMGQFSPAPRLRLLWEFPGVCNTADIGHIPLHVDLGNRVQPVCAAERYFTGLQGVSVAVNAWLGQVCRRCGGRRTKTSEMNSEHVTAGSQPDPSPGPGKLVTCKRNQLP